MNKFIEKLSKLAIELEKSSNIFHQNMIVNDMEILYKNHIKQVIAGHIASEQLLTAEEANKMIQTAIIEHEQSKWKDFNDESPDDGRLVMIIIPPEQKAKPDIRMWYNYRGLEVIDGCMWAYAEDLYPESYQLKEGNKP